VIDVRQLRSAPDDVRAALARRGKPDLLQQLDRIIELDRLQREVTARRDALRADVNELSKKVGALRKAGDAAAAEELQSRSRRWVTTSELSRASTTRTRPRSATSCWSCRTCRTRTRPTAAATTRTRS
jgi:seryl-tRNA synthetase